MILRRGSERPARPRSGPRGGGPDHDLPGGPGRTPTLVAALEALGRSGARPASLEGAQRLGEWTLTFDDGTRIELAGGREPEVDDVAADIRRGATVLLGIDECDDGGLALLLMGPATSVRVCVRGMTVRTDAER